jgi:tetratricopeptide (TPR) repeat protein
MERAADSAPAIRALAPEMDAQWALTITRCLQRDPSKRFATAGNVATALQPRWRPPMVYWNRRQWITAAGVAAVGVALVPVGLRFTEQTPVLPEGAEALLIPIANSTGEPQLDGITELFRNQLAQSVRLNLLESRRLSSALVQMGKPEDSTDPEALREAAWRSNAVVSIFGGVSKVGPDYALNIQLETRGSQPDNPRTKTLRSFPASDPAALMRSVRDASIWVRETIGESATTIASFDRLPADTTTESWEALTYYARGQQFYMKNDWEHALLQFRAALQEDPKFTLAAMRLGDVLMSQNQQTAGIAQWQTAIAMLKERPVTRAEELFGRGMFAFDSGDLEASERHFRTWAVEYPHDWRAAFYRWIPLCMNGHAAQALEVLSALKPVVPEYADLYTGLIACHLILGQTNAARELVPTVRRLSPPNRKERADLREASIRFREADLVGYLEVLRTIQKSTYRRGAADAMLEEGLLLIDAGYPEGAAANIDRFLRSGSWVETAPEQTSLRVVQAWAEMTAGRRDAAVEHARLALQSESGPLVVALTGTVFARSGARARAREALRMTDDFQDLHLYRMARHRIGGELAYADGRLDVAISELRSAAALEPAVAHRQYLIEALPPGSPERLELSRNALRVPWQSLRPPVMHHIGAMRVAVTDVNAAGLTDPFAHRFAESSMKLEAVI